MTDIEISKQSDYFIVKHHDPVLTRSALDQSFSALCDLFNRASHFRCGICDLTNLSRFAVTEREFEEVQLAMTSIFYSVSPNFRFIVVVKEEKTANLIRHCHEYLKENGISSNVFLAPDLESALVMRG